METLKSKIVSSGKYVAVCCPFCANAGKLPDTKYHLYVLPGKWYYCFRCQKKGAYAEFVQHYRINVALPQERIAQSSTRDDFDELVKKNVIDFNDSYYSEAALSYLKRRHITDEIRELMNIKLGTDDLFGRVVFLDKQNKYYVGRAFLPNVSPKTLNPPHSIKPLMYLSKKVYRSLYIVEGTFDLVPFVKTKRDAVCLLGKDISPQQMSQLQMIKVSNILITLDVDAIDSAVALGKKLATIQPFSNIGVYLYKNTTLKDPSEWDVDLFKNASIAWQRIMQKDEINAEF